MDRINFLLLILVQFTSQKVARHSSFFGHPGGGEDVHATEFVFGLAEVVDLHPAFFHKRFEAVVQAADAHAQLLGQLSSR